MPAAKDKATLLDVTAKEWSKLQTLLEQVSETDALIPDVDAWSIRDVVVHRAHWIDLFLGWVAAATSGAPLHMPAKGYKWNELKSYNETVRRNAGAIDWASARATLVERHGMLTGLITSMDDAALYGAPMSDQSKWTTGRYAEASGPSHYRSASRFVRAMMRQHQR